MILLTIVLLTGVTADIQGDWTAVKPAVDLETTLLEIKTNSTLESEDYVEVYFYNSQGEDAGGVYIYFTSTPQYRLYWCSSRTNFTSNLPAAVDKVWRISLNKTSGIRLQIHCNDVEVVNFLLSDDTCDRSYWRKYWSRDVEKIAFSIYDTASDYYRLYQQGEDNLIYLLIFCDIEMVWAVDYTNKKGRRGSQEKFRNLEILKLTTSGDWTAVVQPAVDLETTPLEIKTNSTLGSGDYVRVLFYNSQGEDAGAVRIHFYSTPQYWIESCSSSYTSEAGF
ncbi:hypothetical protein ACHWQZ_G005136 [Mnemiopsis leidyi]